MSRSGRQAVATALRRWRGSLRPSLREQAALADALKTFDHQLERLDHGTLRLVVLGRVGVGKSSLLNALIPGLALRTAAVSGRLERGRHTTRHVELHDLGAAALLADTPGFNRPELPSDPHHWPLLFPEIRRQLQAGATCRFRDCRHDHEPGCAIERGWDRYGQYRDGLAVFSPPGPDRGGSGRR